MLLLAARIPPELFENILFYVNVHCGSRTYLYRKRGGRASRNMPNELTQCSLVCLFWANRCREHVFSDRTLQINSYEDAEIVRRYVVDGCPRLTPVHRLITGIDITQNYSGMLAPQGSERQTSFLHLLYLLAIRYKLRDLYISGPVPDGFNPAKLDTPHWGIPPYIVVPSSFPQNQVFLTNVHLPSFYHVTKYIRHFICVAFFFNKITWDGQTPMYSLPQASNKITCQRRPLSLGVSVTGVCTNSVHLALTALMLNPNCPLHRLSEEERVWMIKFMTLLWGDEYNKDPYIGEHRMISDVIRFPSSVLTSSALAEFNVSEHATTIHARPFRFVFEEAPASTDRAASALSVAGMYTYIYENAYLPPVATP